MVHMTSLLMLTWITWLRWGLSAFSTVKLFIYLRNDYIYSLNTLSKNLKDASLYNGWTLSNYFIKGRQYVQPVLKEWGFMLLLFEDGVST